MDRAWAKQTEGVLRKAEPLFAPWCIAWFDQLLPNLEAADPLAALDRVLCHTLSAGPASARDDDGEAEFTAPYPRKEVPVSADRPPLARARQLVAENLPHREGDRPYALAPDFPMPPAGLAGGAGGIFGVGDFPVVRNTKPRHCEGLSDQPAGKETVPLPENREKIAASQATRLVTEVPELRNFLASVVEPSPGVWGTSGAVRPELSPPAQASEVSSSERAPHRQDEALSVPSGASRPPLAVMLPEKEGLRGPTGTAGIIPGPDLRGAGGSGHRQPDDQVPVASARFDGDPLVRNPAGGVQRHTIDPQSTEERGVGHPFLAPSGPTGLEAELAGAGTAAPDPAWEEMILERLLERWEERLREQAVRHLGFTGGLI